MRKVFFYVFAIAAILIIKGVARDNFLGNTVLQWASIPTAFADPQLDDQTLPIDMSSCEGL